MLRKDISVVEELPASSYASYVPISVFERKRRNSSRITGSSYKRRLKIATGSATAIVMTKDVSHVAEAVKWSLLSPRVVAA